MSSSSIMSDTSEEDQLPPGVSAVLRHPSGVDVFIVGVAHVSEKSCKDVARAINTTNPGLVFIELDLDRLLALVLFRVPSDPYVNIASALLGAPIGNEMLTAMYAANQVGAKVILGDRNLQITKQRRSKAMKSEAIPILKETIGSLLAVSKSPSTENVMEPVKDTWNSSLIQAGCIDPDTVIASFKRIIMQGVLPKGCINIEDVLVVRQCGNAVVESLRQEGSAGGAEHARALEEIALSEVGINAYIAKLNIVSDKVVREERDLILARGLFEVGEYSGKWPVVGVVGAAHVKGIQEQWGFACTPEAAQQVAGLMEAPSPELAGSLRL